MLPQPGAIAFTFFVLHFRDSATFPPPRIAAENFGAMPLAATMGREKERQRRATPLPAACEKAGRERLLRQEQLSGILMRNYDEFTVTSLPEGNRYHCRFHTLITGIAPRHSDTVDLKFLVNGRPVVVALPHAAFAEYRHRTGGALTDADAIHIAARFLESLLRKGERVEQRLLNPTVQETVELACQVHSEAGTAAGN